MPVAHALRLTCEELGATYVKFGQFVGSAPDIVSDRVAAEFRSCLDTGPAVPFDIVRAVIETEFGQPVGRLFRQIDARPLAAASVAVVHRAELHDGRLVAVKVLRPGMDGVVSSDLALMQPLFRFLARQGLDAADGLSDYLIGLRDQVTEELDLRNEAAAMDRFRDLFAQLGLARLVVPVVYPALSGRRVLTMEFLNGVPIDDLARIEAYGVDPRPLVEELMRAWILTAVHDGSFHADIHAGNLLLLPDARLGMIDWGIVARLEPETHRLVRTLLECALGVEAAWDALSAHFIRIRGTALREGLGLTDEQIYRLIRGIMEPVLTQPVGEVSMASVFSGTEESMRIATGEAPRRPTLRDRWGLWQKARRAYRLQQEQQTAQTSFSRSSFLAGKQLVYLERYWKMYLPEKALLGDRDFLKTVLAQADAAAAE